MLLGVFWLINLVLFMVIFVPVAQRLLAVRFGLLRLAIGAALMLAVFTPLMNAMAGLIPSDAQANSITPLWFLILGILCAVLTGLVFLVLAEAVVPTGSLPRLRDLRRDLGGRVARTRRYLQILRIAARHGLGPYLRGRRRPGRENAAGQAELARSLRLALDDAGVTFVKLGQVLSTRSDVIPASVAAELSRLQDQVTPVPWPEGRAGAGRRARRATAVRELRAQTHRGGVDRPGVRRNHRRRRAGRRQGATPGYHCGGRPRPRHPPAARTNP